MSQTFGSPSKRRKPSINITSLIDVMFLLLIFFMVSSTFREASDALDITLPRAGSASAQSLDYFEISVVVDGTLYFEGEEVGEAALRAALEDLVAGDSEAKVVLRADSGADFGGVIRAIDIARGAGVVNLIIPTDRVEGARGVR
jgi:biopolymer transport protein ExbD